MCQALVVMAYMLLGLQAAVTVAAHLSTFMLHCLAAKALCDESEFLSYCSCYIMAVATYAAHRCKRSHEQPSPEIRVAVLTVSTIA